MALREPAANTTEARTDEYTTDVNSVGQGAGRTTMIIHDQSLPRRNIASFADPHEGARDEELIECPGVTGEPCDGGPCKQARDNHARSTETICHESSKWTQRAVHPKKHRGQQPKLRICH